MMRGRQFLRTVQSEIIGLQNIEPKRRMAIGIHSTHHHLPENTTSLPVYTPVRNFRSLIPSSSSSSSVLKLRRNNRRQKPKQLARTKRNRIRNFEKGRSQASLLSSIKLPNANPEKVADSLESSLLFVRNSIFNFWSTGGASIVPQQQGQTTAAAVPKNVLPPRPARLGPKMDAYWWFWNICLALMPAAFLTIYFEFIVKDEAEAFFRRMQAEERKRQGLEDDTIDDENDDTEPFIPLQTNKSLSEKMDDVYQIFAHVLFNNDDNDKESSEHDNHKYQQQQSPPTKSQSSAVADERGGGVSERMKGSVPEISSTPTQESYSQQQHQPSPDTMQSDDEADKENEENIDPAVLEMRQRIEELERLVTEQIKKDLKERKQKERRSNQSNVQNRIEQRNQKERERDLAQAAEQQQDSSSNERATMTDQFKDAILHTIHQNVSSKKEQLQKYGTDIMDKVLGKESTNEKKDNNAHVDGDVALKSTSTEDFNKKTTNLVTSVEASAAATKRAAQNVSASISNSDPKAAAEAAFEASKEATKAAQAAQKAANALLPSPKPDLGKDQQPPPSQGFLKRSWRSLFHQRPAPPPQDPTLSKNGDESNSDKEQK